MSDYYTPPVTPVLRSDLSSQEIKDSFGALAAAFELLPPPIGGGIQGFTGGQFNTASISGATILSSTLGSNASPCWGTIDYLILHKNNTPVLGAGNRGLANSIAGDITLKDNITTQMMWDTVGNTIPCDPAVATATGATAGFFYIPLSTGTSAGVPTNVYAGAVPLIYNTNTNKLGVYSGGAWKFSGAFV